jgi:hypothetical protein
MDLNHLEVAINELEFQIVQEQEQENQEIPMEVVGNVVEAPNDPAAEGNPQPNHRHKSPMLSDLQKWRICIEYAARMTLHDDKMTRLMLEELVNITGYCARTVRYAWNEYSNQRNIGFGTAIDLEPTKIKGHSVKRRRNDSEEIQQTIKGIINEKGGDISYRAVI